VRAGHRGGRLARAHDRKDTGQGGAASCRYGPRKRPSRSPVSSASASSAGCWAWMSWSPRNHSTRHATPEARIAASGRVRAGALRLRPVALAAVDGDDQGRHSQRGPQIGGSLAPHRPREWRGGGRASTRGDRPIRPNLEVGQRGLEPLRRPVGVVLAEVAFDVAERQTDELGRRKTLPADLPRRKASRSPSGRRRPGRCLGSGPDCGRRNRALRRLPRTDRR